MIQSGPPTAAGHATPASAGTTAGASSTTATGAGEAPTRFLSVRTFQSPSKNIGCTIVGGLARCDIVQRSWQPPPRPSSCPQIVDFGQGVEVSASGPGRLVCAGDTARDPASPSLEYGTATRAEGFTCVSRVTGMTCTSTGGHGFQLSRQAYRVF